MDLIKICPVCGEKNPADAFDCKCGYDLLMVSPETDTVEGAEPRFEENAGASRDSAATIVDQKRELRLVGMDGAGSLNVESGSIIGREAEGMEIFAKQQTVSRRHARITLDGTQWMVEDLGSTNGTWVNERQIPIGAPWPLKPGDTLALSRACVFKVKG